MIIINTLMRPTRFILSVSLLFKRAAKSEGCKFMGKIWGAIGGERSFFINFAA